MYFLLRSQVYATEKVLSEHKGKISDADVASAEKLIAEVKAAREAGDAAELKAKFLALQTETMRIGAAIHSAGNAAAGGAAAGAGAAGAEEPKEKVVDADFEEKKEKK